MAPCFVVDGLLLFDVTERSFPRAVVLAIWDSRTGRGCRTPRPEPEPYPEIFLDGKLTIETPAPGFMKTNFAASTVRDTETGDVIIKIVSGAEEAVKTSIDHHLGNSHSQRKQKHHA